MKSLRKILSVFTLLIFISLMSIGIMGCKSKKNVEEVKVVETIPFELIDGIIILDVKINKTVDAKFIFDSGEENMTLDPKLVKKLKLKKGDTFIIMGIKDDILILRKVNVEKILKEISEGVVKSGLIFENLEKEIEREANRLAEEKLHG